jgi:hypothetical protein
MRNCFEMCVCTLLKANLVDERVRTYALKVKKKNASTALIDSLSIRRIVARNGHTRLHQPRSKNAPKTDGCWNSTGTPASHAW